MTTAIVKDNVLYYKGSNFIRQRLILSVLSGKPIRITHIRALQDEPGLKEFEVSLVRLLDKITNGTIIELNETGTALYFQPGLLYGGTIVHQCSTLRGIGYYLEALLMLGLFCKQPLHVTLHGVTNNNIDPSADLVKASMLTVLKKFFLDDDGLELKISKRGVLPLGGGEVLFKCPTRKQLRPVQELDGGMVRRVRGTAFALRVSPAIANRMVGAAKGVLLHFLPDVYINTDQCRGKHAGKSPGFGLHLSAETTNGAVYSAEHVSNASGAENAIPEEVGAAAAQRLLYEVYLGGVTDATSQALAILCMALGQQDVSKMVMGPLTEFSIGFLRHLKEFFGVTFKLEHYGAEEEEGRDGVGVEKVMLTCVGIGYKNISKRTI